MGFGFCPTFEDILSRVEEVFRGTQQKRPAHHGISFSPQEQIKREREGKSKEDTAKVCDVTHKKKSVRAQ
jgi:hypothetical protein